MEGLAGEVNESHVDRHTILAATISKIKDVGNTFAVSFKTKQPKILVDRVKNASDCAFRQFIKKCFENGLKEHLNDNAFMLAS